MNPDPIGQVAGPAGARQRLVFRRLVLVTVVLTLCLIMLGAWVRLTDAGLGCPDWPGCYGKLTPIHASEQIQQAVAEQGGEHGPVSMGKAWREMVHRYLASGLGLLIIAIAVLSTRWRGVLRQSPILPWALVGLVVLQGLFGKWTVTLLLKPAIVTGHLIGGMLLFALLVWLWQRQQPDPAPVDAEPLANMRVAALVGLVLVAIQIFLGGWTSTNYAALVCSDLPTCQGKWWPEVDFANAFHMFRELGQTADGEALSMQALTAIHLSHRIAAVVVALYVLWLGLRAMRTGGAEKLGQLILLVLVLQFCLGLANVAFSLPISLAVAHNGGAALLLGAVTVLNYRAVRAGYRI
ncbi:MAG: COX15/CtaA family protein [Gemmatimonadales bacterium]|nr:COX15/CtaA family protein [Gemmatimonadales bacterium]